MTIEGELHRNRTVGSSIFVTGIALVSRFPAASLKSRHCFTEFYLRPHPQFSSGFGAATQGRANHRERMPMKVAKLDGLFVVFGKALDGRRQGVGAFAIHRLRQRRFFRFILKSINQRIGKLMIWLMIELAEQ